MYLDNGNGTGLHIDVERQETDQTVTHIEIWWNTEARIWTMQRMNKDGDQIGPAEYQMNKPQVIRFCENNGDFGNETVPIHLFKNGTELVRIYEGGR